MRSLDASRHAPTGIPGEITSQRRFTSQTQWQVLKSNFVTDDLHAGASDSQINDHKEKCFMGLEVGGGQTEIERV